MDEELEVLIAVTLTRICKVKSKSIEHIMERVKDIREVGDIAMVYCFTKDELKGDGDDDGDDDFAGGKVAIH